LAAAFSLVVLPDAPRLLLFETTMKKFFCIAAALISLASAAHAQSARDTNCSYQECALGLKPVWNGLAVTRGKSEEQVAVLGFFWPGEVSNAFAGDREAQSEARNAEAIRGTAAALTDAGVVMALTGVARSLFRRDWDKLSTALTIAGGASLGVSVPLQFAADGSLSRAVWLFNRKFAR